jgi:hypothetical protein
MNARKASAIALTCAFVLCGVFSGCGGDDDNGGATFRAYIQNFGGDDLVADMDVEVLDNTTGNKLGIVGRSDATGWVTIKWDGQAPAAELGFLCVGVAGDTRNTYQFDLDSSAQDEKLWSVSETTYWGAALAAGLTLEDGKALLAGGLYWVDPADPNEVENHIGCATVKANPEDGEVRYFGDNGYPTNLATRTTTNPLVAYFVIANMEPGSKTVEAFMDADKLGETDLFVYGNDVSISNIYADPNQPDPEPAGCQ